MNEILFWGLIGISSLQVTTSLSVEEVHHFTYNVAKTYAVLALGAPDSAKTRNKNQIFILGQKKPFWIRNKDKSLTLTGPIKIVLSSADVHTTVQSMERKIKDTYNLSVKFSSDTEIIVSDPHPSQGESLYRNLQDEQLNAINSRRERKILKPCITYSRM